LDGNGDRAGGKIGNARSYNKNHTNPSGDSIIPKEGGSTSR
jgi:hypothetical protein